MYFQRGLNSSGRQRYVTGKLVPDVSRSPWFLAMSCHLLASDIAAHPQEQNPQQQCSEKLKICR